MLDGKYRVERVLGRGGMGSVFEVTHLVTRHRRALKTLHAELRDHPELVGRFLREASAAGRIGDPHIIETFDAGELRSGEPFLVMEFLEGETLGEKLQREGTLGVGETLDLMIQATRGVVAAHRAGVVHRDLKPDNIYLTDREGAPFVKLLDFGISKFEALAGEKGITQDGAALGTPFYMAPEQMAGHTRELDAKADVYALGVILYELLSGRKPYDGATIMELAVKVHAGGAPPLSAVCEGIPEALSELVARAMSKAKEDRPSSTELLLALEALAGLVDDAPATGRDRLAMDATQLGAPVNMTSAASTSVEVGGAASPPAARAGAGWAVWAGGFSLVALVAGGLYLSRGAPEAAHEPLVQRTEHKPSAAAIPAPAPSAATAAPSAVGATSATAERPPALPARHTSPGSPEAPKSPPAPPVTTATPVPPAATNVPVKSRSDKAGMATSPY